MDLTSKNHGVQLRGIQWVTLLCEAENYGWIPQGTIGEEHMPYCESFNGGVCECPNLPAWDPMDYSSNSGQLVSCEDAANIATALGGYFTRIKKLNKILEPHYSGVNLDQYLKKLSKLLYEEQDLTALESAVSEVRNWAPDYNTAQTTSLAREILETSPYWISKVEKCIELCNDGGFRIT